MAPPPKEKKQDSVHSPLKSLGSHVAAGNAFDDQKMDQVTGSAYNINNQQSALESGPQLPAVQYGKEAAIHDEESGELKLPEGKLFSMDGSEDPPEDNSSLPNDVKSKIIELSGIDLSDVKVHFNSSKPAQLKAKAFAFGTEIFLGPGQEKELAHEAWHVVQQKQGRVKVDEKSGLNDLLNTDVNLEKEAEKMATQISRSKSNDGGGVPIEKKSKSVKSPVIQRSTYDDIGNINDIDDVVVWKAALAEGADNSYRAYLTYLVNRIDPAIVVGDPMLTLILNNQDLTLDDEAQEIGFEFRDEWNNMRLDLIDAQNRPENEKGEEFKKWLKTLTARKGKEKLFPTNEGTLVSEEEFGNSLKTKKFEKERWQTQKDIEGIDRINYKLLPDKTQEIIMNILINQEVQGRVIGEDASGEKQDRSIASHEPGDLRSWHQNDKGHLPQLESLEEDRIEDERNRQYYEMERDEGGRVQGKQKNKNVKNKFHLTMIEINAGFNDDPTGPRLIYDYLSNYFYITFGHYKSDDGNPFLLIEVPEVWGEKPIIPKSEKKDQAAEVSAEGGDSSKKKKKKKKSKAKAKAKKGGKDKAKESSDIDGLTIDNVGRRYLIGEQVVKIKKTAKDGDCMYNAMIRANGDGRTAEVLRRLVGQQLISTGDMRSANRAMLGEWGEREELLELALIFQMEVHVFSQYGPPEVFNAGGGGPINLLLLGNHYSYFENT